MQMGLWKYMNTAVGLTNELTMNLDVADGLVNGATCTTMQIGNRCVWVKFNDDSIGAKARTESRNLFTSNVDKTWVPIKHITRQFPVGRYRNAKISRQQYPLQLLSSAKTVHRSSGHHG
jgi:hypothetical protein